MADLALSPLYKLLDNMGIMIYHFIEKFGHFTENYHESY
jgi:hypothetical protein